MLTLSRSADAGGGFTDTPPWIAAHAAWLQDNGIADGYPNGRFDPDGNISRGQAGYWFGNYNDSIEFVYEETNPAPGSVFTGTATCPTGKRAVAGGGQIAPLDGVYMTTSELLSLSPNSDAWFVRWESESDATVDLTNLRVSVLCVPDPVPTNP
ncbi:MAG: S-layer homology domain-containing protein [Actinomycetota bacterium]